MSTICRHAIDVLHVHRFESDNLRLYCTSCNTTFVITVSLSWSVSVRSLRALRKTLPARPTNEAYAVVEVTA